MGRNDETSWSELQRKRARLVGQLDQRHDRPPARVIALQECVDHRARRLGSGGETTPPPVGPPAAA
jgi:hypothetical protein